MTRGMSTRLLVTVVALAGCAKDPQYIEPPPDPGPPDWPRGLHVVDNQIQDGSGNAIVLRGVNRSGSEYMCVQGTSMFDGPSSDESIQAIRTWPKINSVRIPLNESCWLGINGVGQSVSGDAYKAAIRNYVLRLHKHDLIPILELHWVGPGGRRANRLQPMPDADHAPAFWADVATTFLDDDGVILEPFNEPYPDGNRDNDAAWSCWRDGCTSNEYVDDPAGGRPMIVGTYQSAGMQSLVDAIRSTGSTHVILLGGVQYSNALTQWLTHKPNDPMGQLGAAWHIYSNNACASATCWDGVPATVAAAVPVVATEIGQYDCTSTFITPLMQWLDGHNLGYLPWSWNAFGACIPRTMTSAGQPLSLVTDYFNAAPNSPYAQGFYDHLAGL
jgi:endoglucanase